MSPHDFLKHGINYEQLRIDSGLLISLIADDNISKRVKESCVRILNMLNNLKGIVVENELLNADDVFGPNPETKKMTHIKNLEFSARLISHIKERKETFENVRKDYLKIISKCGPPADMTGGFVDSEQMEKIVLNPTKKNAMEYMKSIIQYGFQHGAYWNSEGKGLISTKENETVNEMYERYINFN
ncbi:hypothetical protein LCGC14_0337440 [marine sediment metagenome]|uniref:Uncharacterized protein n=1 Tax=marine sediment metagenome TaxID=412755 RepID=A0A0F9TXN5_9ZZZZ